MNSLPHSHPKIHNRGIALVIVLGFLVILFGLVTAFLLRTNIERQSAASFAASVSTAQLSDAAVNLVQGQIRSATTQGSTIAWASQPGMIRNFDTSGTLTRAFKLYSASNLIYNGGNWADEMAADVAPATWAADVAHWTDLNAPVNVPNPAGGSTDPVPRFPILDPAAQSNVEGFDVSGTNSPAMSATHPMPMPVRWLYMLKDGTLAAPESGTGDTATIPGADTNPIVGRVAFWTDDETCKLNINTASEGTYWDVPRVHTKEDMAYGRFQPARNEFQRYPGHPAMTSLAPVFFATDAVTTGTLSTIQRDGLYSMAPRIIGGGSNAGTRVPPKDPGVLTPDSDRLYASVDELYFAADRNPQLAAADISMQKLEYSRFFLTASSRAPETTLFDTPRVAMWPLDVQTGTDSRSAYDRLLARCATINDKPYYFTRSDPGSATVDFPGAPTKDPQVGLDRNRNLYAYLQDLTSDSRAIPGFGGSFLEKYGADRDEILTLMFDYIRSTNTDDSTLAGAYRYGLKRLSLPSNITTASQYFFSKAYGVNQVVPIRIQASAGATQGLGRFPVVTEAGIVFIASADGSGFTRNGVKPTLSECDDLPKVKAANDAKLDSNVVANKTLGGTLLKGEGYLDVGYGGSKTGAENGLFDWDDSTAVAGFPGWQNNGTCDFEPFDDANGDGQYTSGEDYWDANDNGQWDGETHEPMHDWGRKNAAQPAWNSAYWDGLTKQPVWTGVDWAAFLALRDRETQSNGRYEPSERRMEALFFLEKFTPGQGYPPVKANVSTRVAGLDAFSVEPTGSGTPISLGFPSDAISALMQWGGYGEQVWGGTISARTGLGGMRLPARGAMPADSLTDILATEQPYYRYPFVSIPITVEPTQGTMTFSGGAITISLYPGRDATISDTPVQTMTLNFPAAPIPIPKLVSKGTTYNKVTSQYRDTAKEDWWTFSYDGCLPGAAVSPDLKYPIPSPRSVGRLNNWQWVGGDSDTPLPSMPGMFFRDDSDVVRSMVPANSDFRLLAAKPVIAASDFEPHRNYENSSIRLAHSLVEPYDSTSIGMNEPAGLEMLLALPATSYLPRARPDVAFPHANSLSNGDWDNGIGLAADGPYSNMPDGGNARNLYGGVTVPYFMSTLETNAAGSNYDASGIDYANDPEGDGTIAKPWYSMNAVFTLFSPNRQIPSAGMFGSLPTGVKSGQPYQTLLFRPQVGHAGFDAPRDHLWTDLFWMPVVEPYAISEPFSTAGKINMNYQIMPFRYITRYTAMAGLMRSERIPLIPTKAGFQMLHWSTKKPFGGYKDPIHSGDGLALADRPRRPLIDIPQTIAQFQTIFDGGDIFHSPSQICDLYLIPTGETLATVSAAAFWTTRFALTGDNSRERPYTNLLGRLTTKSNTYTVHYRVQSLKQNPSSTPGTWNEQKDRVLAESRGATLIERYINPNDKAIPDYPTATNPESLGSFYKWRVVNTRTFAP